MEIPFEEILARLERIEFIQKEILEKMRSGIEGNLHSENMNVKSLISYLKERTGKSFSKSTIYAWTNKKIIPFLKANRKSLVFEKEKIDQWLSEGQDQIGLDQRMIYYQSIHNANIKRINKKYRV